MIEKNNRKIIKQRQNNFKNNQKDITNEMLYKRINKRLNDMEKLLYKCIENYEESKNAELMIISRLENIADFLKHNYNVVIEERFNYNPYDD